MQGNQQVSLYTTTKQTASKLIVQNYHCTVNLVQTTGKAMTKRLLATRHTDTSMNNILHQKLSYDQITVAAIMSVMLWQMLGFTGRLSRRKAVAWFGIIIFFGM